MKKAKPEIVIPEDAHISYTTPSYTAGKYTHYRQNAIIQSSEEEARKIAAGWGGNGSGVIYKWTRFTQYVNQGNLKGSIAYDLVEDLPPVTNFNEEGLKRRKKFLEMVNCPHKNTRSVMWGAGCYKDYDIVCNSCGETVG